MNADIVYKLCPYLDVGSLLALAAAYPIWSPMVRKYMEKKKLYVNLTLECEANVETLKYEYSRWESDVFAKSVLTEVFSRALHIDSVAITHITQECEAVVEKWEYEELCWPIFQMNRPITRNFFQDFSRKSDALPKSVWKEVSSRVLDIDSVAITQKDNSPISEDVYALLTRITTHYLKLVFHGRGEARKVLRAISFGPRSALILIDESIGPDQEPLLQASQLGSFGCLLYIGQMPTLSNDLLTLLESDHTMLRVEALEHLPATHLIRWVAVAVKKHLDARGQQVRCIVHDRMQYEFKRLVDGEEPSHTTRRRIEVSLDSCDDCPGTVWLYVENSK